MSIYALMAARAAELRSALRARLGLQGSSYNDCGARLLGARRLIISGWQLISGWQQAALAPARIRILSRDATV